MFELLSGIATALDDRVERWLAGRAGWRNTFLLALVSQTVTSFILLGAFAILGTVVYLCLWSTPDTLWIWWALLAGVLILLAIAIRQWRSNLFEDDLEQHELDKTRFCPKCGRECSVGTPVCPRCETELR